MSTRRSILNSFLGKYLNMLIQIISSIIIARLLLPEEIGIFSVAAAVLGFAQMFRDFGINSYIVQEKNLTAARLRAAFTLNLIISWSLGILVYFGSGYAARFYETPGIMEILKITSLVFFLIPFGAISVAMLQRNMQFGKLNIINLLGAIAGAMVSIGGAYLGFSYISLAWGTLTNSAITILVTQFYRQPVTLYPSFREMRNVLHYGSLASFTQLVNYLGSSAPDIILGKVLNMSAVGIFGRAAGLLSMIQQFILSIIKPVLLPHLAKLQDCKKTLATQFLTATHLMLGFAWPALGFLILEAGLVIEVLYGPNWLPAAPLAQIVGVGFFVVLLTNLSEELFKSSGQIKTLAKIIFFLAPIRFLAVLLAAPYGLTTVAITLACIPVLRVLITIRFLRRLYKIRYRMYLPIIWSNCLLTGFPLCLVYLANQHYPVETLINRLLVDSTLFSVLWLITLFLLKHPFSNEITRIFKRRKNQTTHV